MSIGAGPEDGGRRQGRGVAGRACWELTSRYSDIDRIGCLQAEDAQVRGHWTGTQRGAFSPGAEHPPHTVCILQSAFRVSFYHFYLAGSLLKTCWRFSISLKPERTPNGDVGALASSPRPPAGRALLPTSVSSAWTLSLMPFTWTAASSP